MSKFRMMAATALIVSAMTGSALADSRDAGGPSENDMVESRQQLMGGIGGTMGLFGCYMKERCDLKSEVLALQARGLVYLTGMAPAAFETPTPNATVRTTSADGIWSDWQTFEGGLEAMNGFARDLAAAAGSGDSERIGPSRGQLGGTCRSCHSKFREK